VELRESILSVLDTLLEEFPPSEREEWKDFLIALAEHSEDREKLQEFLAVPLGNLFSSTTPLDFLAGVQKIRNRVQNFPLIPVLEEAIAALSRIFEEKNRLIRDLREIPSQLAVPVIDIWEGVVLLPLIGTLDSERAQRMTEVLLNAIADRKSRIAIVDVSGLPFIDTAVGAHLVEAFNAVRLLGAEVVLTGIKPEIAQTLVKLGVGFEVTIQRDLQEALLYSISLLRRRKEERRRATENLETS